MVNCHVKSVVVWPILLWYPRDPEGSLNVQETPIRASVQWQVRDQYKSEISPQIYSIYIQGFIKQRNV